MTEKYVDPAHRLPDEDYAAVVRRAQECRAEDGGDESLDLPADLLALAAQDPDPSLFPDADGDGIPDHLEGI